MAAEATGSPDPHAASSSVPTAAPVAAPGAKAWPGADAVFDAVEALLEGAQDDARGLADVAAGARRELEGGAGGAADGNLN